MNGFQLCINPWVNLCLMSWHIETFIVKFPNVVSTPGRTSSKPGLGSICCMKAHTTLSRYHLVCKALNQLRSLTLWQSALLPLVSACLELRGIILPKAAYWALDKQNYYWTCTMETTTGLHGEHSRSLVLRCFWFLLTNIKQHTNIISHSDSVSMKLLK